MNIYDIVKKLVGKTTPYADSAIDKERFENVKILIDLHQDITFDLQNIARVCKDSPYGSVKEIGQYADKYLNDEK